MLDEGCPSPALPKEILANDSASGPETIPSQQKLDALRPRWNTLYKETLPSLARSKSPSQPHWPVHLDHCFARIIYDAIIGNSTGTRAIPSTPWTSRIASPAIQNMHPRDLEDCIKLGEAIAEGAVNLVELDRASLAARGKLVVKATKRKRGSDVDGGTAQPPLHPSIKKPKPTPPKDKSPPTHQPDIRTALGLSPSPSKPPLHHRQTKQKQPQPPPSPIPAHLHHKITTSPHLTPFRRLVLLSLCLIPRGHFTTYSSLSAHLHSSPRAVGNALRNNPFAPEVPCHRVVAAGGGIGGFGGEWGDGGIWCGEKVRLLRGEGVKVDVEGEERGGKVRVKGKVWEGWL